MNKDIFIDTNYFLRFLLEDNSSQSNRAKALFMKGAKNKITLHSSVLVFFEIKWVLQSVYKHNKSKLLIVLANILKMSFIKWDDNKSSRLISSLLLFEKYNLALEDCYIMHHAILNNQKLATFDQKLIKAFVKESSNKPSK